MDISDNLTKTFKIPISYLDYDYIEKSTNVSELEKIYLTLKIGEEGKYPDLEQFCEKRLTKLSPNSRVLRKPTELISLNQLEEPVKKELLNDFQSWVDDMRFTDSTIKNAGPSRNGDNSGFGNFPIRCRKDISATIADVSSEKLLSKNCKPKDYNEWSKIANELEKQMILEEQEELSPSTVDAKIPKKLNSDVDSPLDTINTSNLTKLEKEKIALLEKNKGNEAFKSGDLSEAIIYYTRSLSVKQISDVFNNRGLVYMKQKKWEEALRDLSLTLKKDPTNTKALQRRATCYSEIHNLPDAISDCRKILEINPNNKFAESLLTTSLEELEKRTKSKLKDGKRMIITEIGSDDESSDDDENKKIIENKKFIEISVVEKDLSEDREVQKNIEITPIESIDTNNQDTSEEQFLKLKDYGNQLFKELKYDDALRIYDQLIEGWPSNPIGYRNRAACNLVLEHADEVIKDCSTAIELDNESHLSYYRRGKAYKILKMYYESCTDLEMALSFSPNHNQIKDELSEVKAILEQVNISQNTMKSLYDELKDNLCSVEMQTEILVSETSSSNEDTICVSNIDEQEAVNQDVSNSWEMLGLSDLADCVEHSVIDDLTVSLQRSTDKPMTKCEFDRQLNNIRVKSTWQTTIQLLLDAEPANLKSLIGTNLDGFVLESIVASLLEYSKNKEHSIFIKTVLHELTKVERFGFVKMMISDYALSELDQLFKYLRQNNDLGEIDCLQHKYL